MRRTHTVGLVSYDANDPLAIRVSFEADQFLYQRGYRSILGDAQHDSARAHRHVEEFLAGGVDAIVLLANSYQPQPETLTSLETARTPTVCIGRDLSLAGVMSFVVDNRSGSQQLADHLIQAGYRQFGVIVGADLYEPDSRDRFQGVRDALRAAGIVLDDRLVVREQEAGWNPSAGYESMQALLQQGRPDVVVAFDDCTAYGAIRAVTEAGLRVPHDLAVVGFDDLPMSAFYNPPLTTVRQPIEELVSEACEFLLARLDGRDSTGAVCRKRQPDLVVRNSSRN
jgi:LacI family transcriptional regulator